MTPQNTNLEKVMKMIESAEASLKSAKQIMEKLLPDYQSEKIVTQSATLEAVDDGEHQIVEGIFDGQNMIGPNGKIYPVPANYASKSKLLEGDKLKLTVMPNGSFIYKQIEPIARKHIKGTLIKEDGQFKILTPTKTYRVLLASVTYYKADVGDDVSIIVPEDESSIWATIEAVIPHIASGSSSLDSF